MTAAIHVEGLTKFYNLRRSLREMALHPARRGARLTALRDVSFEVRPGEIFGILGPNGAGKTTLLKILSGLVTPTRGVARIAGLDVEHQSPQARRVVGLVSSDERSFYWRLSGRENLRFFGMLYGLEGPRLRRRCDELLEEMEITSRADQLFMDYPTGVKQRLAIARALLHDPAVIFLDEPTRSLDPMAAKHIRLFLCQEMNRRRGKTLLLATHNLAEAESVCDRLAVLSAGSVLRQGTLSEVTANLPGRAAYELQVVGLRGLPSDPRWELEATHMGNGHLEILARVDRDGTTLSALLGAILAAGGTIHSCAPSEPALQEVFDRVVPGSPAEESRP